MNKTSIEWTHRPGTVGMTWNPIRARHKETGKVGWACTHASTGCLRCYAETINKRFGTGLPFNVPSLDQVEFFVDEKTIEEPLRQKKPSTIFVGDMFDLFHEAIPDDFIRDIFRIMEVAQRHVFQVLTKRADRLHAFVAHRNEHNPHLCPAPNVWVGVSVENQKYADERIPLLLSTPAVVRFLSVEPMLEKVSLTCVGTPANHLDAVTGPEGVDWVICGGESGPGARPFNLAWAESLLKQCRAAGVPFFMKQIGSKPEWSCTKAEDGIAGTIYPPIRDRKGGSPEDWPEHLRVREFPSPQMELKA